MDNLTSLQRYHLFAKHAFELAIILMNKAGIIVEWSAGAEKLLGWTAEEAIGQSVSLIFTPEDLAQEIDKAELDTAQKFGHALDIRWHMRRDGSRLFVDGVVNAIYADDGQTLVGFSKSMRQALMVDEKVADQPEETPERRSFLAAVLETIEDGIVACDAQGKLTFFNRATRQFHGLPEAPLPPEQWSTHYDLYGPGGKTPLATHQIPLFRALKGENVQNAEMVIAPKVGKSRTLLANARPMMDAAGQILGAVVSMHDVSTQLQVQQAKEEAIIEQARRYEAEHHAHKARVSEERFRSLVMASSQVVWTAQADGRVAEDSPTWRTFTGQSWEQYQGNGWADAIHPDDRETTLRIWQQATERKTPYQSEFRIRHVAGDYRWIAVRAVPLKSEDGSIREWIGTNTDITERKKAERHLQNTKERLQLATDAAELGIWMWEVEADKATWENDRLWNIIGIPKTEGPVNTEHFLKEIIYLDDVETYKRAMETCLATNGRFHSVCRFYRQPNRELRWIEFTGLMHPASKDHPARIIGTAADITERKIAEEALKETRSRLEATLAAGEVATWQWDLLNDHLVADQNLARIFALTDEQAAGAPSAVYLNAIHPDDVESVSLQISKAIDDGQPYQAIYRVRAGQDKYRWVIAQGRVQRDEHGTPVSLPGVVIDITRQKEAEEALRQTQDRYRMLVESMDDGFSIVEIIYDDHRHPVDYRFLEVNPAFAGQTGLKDAQGKTARELVPGLDSHWAEIYSRVALTGESIRIIEESVPLRRWFDVYASRVGDPKEGKVAILFKDITKSKRAENDLRNLAADLSRENRRKTEFLATLAHELRNPLAPIRTGLDLIRLSGNNPSATAKVHEMMGRQLNQMVHLIDDLLDIARINSGKVQLKNERIELREVISSAVEAALPAIEAAQHQLEVAIPDVPILLNGDSTRLAQIMSNLLTNAAKYTPNGGKVKVSVQKEEDVVVISVTDTGIGIPEQALPDLFEMFSQVSRNMGRSQGGLGIGLSLVQSLVQMHGGAVIAESGGEGLGSTFTVRLPLLTENDVISVLPLKRGATEDVSARNTLKILVADDNIDAAKMMMSLLELSGHDVDLVHDGLQALEKAKAGHYDLVILDIGMPGLNGYEVAAAIREIPRNELIFLAALTGWGAEDDRSRSQRAGFNAHLTKPAGINEINALITAIANNRRPSAN